MTLQMRDNENIEEGRKEGSISTLVSLVKDGLLSLTDAASRADMSEEEFEKLIK